MVNIYSSNLETGKLEETEEIKKGCWINLENPTEQEIKDFYCVSRQPVEKTGCLFVMFSVKIASNSKNAACKNRKKSV